MDHGFSRAKEPWEETEGALFLLGEMSDLHFDKVSTHFETVRFLGYLA